MFTMKKQGKLHFLSYENYNAAKLLACRLIAGEPDLRHYEHNNIGNTGNVTTGARCGRGPTVQHVVWLGDPNAMCFLNTGFCSRNAS
jgi:hypothetical protein